VLYVSRRRPAPILSEDPAVKDLSPVVEAYKQIKQRAYRDVSAGQACRGAIEGMVGKVDDYSAYIPPERVASFDRRVLGSREETGLRIALEHDVLVVVGSLPGSPADEAGVAAGMEVLAIDGEDAKYLTLPQARKMLESPVRRRVNLLLRRPDGKEVQVELKVSRFDVETVTGIVRDEKGHWVHTLDPRRHICYIRISEFVQRTPEELHAAYRQLDEPRGLVLDLRDNPGGMLRPAVEVADRFLNGGVIVRKVSREGHPEIHRAGSAATYPLVPTVVLINLGTASAAEIVAGALHAHGRALLVGEPSHGKWWGQTLVDLGHGWGQLYLTTAEYFLPEPVGPTTRPQAPGASRSTGKPPRRRKTPGRGDSRAGLRPDVPVRIPARTRDRLALLRLRARVSAHSVSGQGAPAATGSVRWARLRRSILALDSQLARALELLRAGKVPTTRPAGSGPYPLEAPPQPTGAER